MERQPGANTEYVSQRCILSNFLARRRASSSSKLAMVLAWKSAKDMSPRRRVIMLGLIFLRRVQNSKSQAFQFLGPHRMVEGRQFGTSMLTMPAATGRHHFLWQSPEQTVEGCVGRRCVKDKRWACWEGGGGYFIRFMGKDCGLGSGLMFLNQLGCLPTSTLGQSYNENRCRWVRRQRAFTIGIHDETREPSPGILLCGRTNPITTEELHTGRLKRKQRV